MTGCRGWRIVLGAVLTMGLAGAAAAQDSLTVVSNGGSVADAQRKAFMAKVRAAMARF